MHCSEKCCALRGTTWSFCLIWLTGNTERRMTLDGHIGGLWIYAVPVNSNTTRIIINAGRKVGPKALASFLQKLVPRYCAFPRCTSWHSIARISRYAYRHTATCQQSCCPCSSTFAHPLLLNFCAQYAPVARRTTCHKSGLWLPFIMHLV